MGAVTGIPECLLSYVVIRVLSEFLQKNQIPYISHVTIGTCPKTWTDELQFCLRIMYSLILGETKDDIFHPLVIYRVLHISSSCC